MDGVPPLRRTGIAAVSARNVDLTREAGRMRARGMDEAAIEHELLKDPKRDGLPAAEVRAIAKSIGAKPPGRTVERPATGWISAVHELADRRGWAVSALECLGALAKRREVHFPMKLASGAVVGWRRRRADNQPFKNGKKAIAVTGSRAMLMAPAELPDGPVVMTESETDAAAIISAGHPAVLASAGGSPSAGCIEEAQRLLAGRAVVLFPDPDAVGDTWRKRVGNALTRAGCVVSYVPPVDCDIDARLARDPDRRATLKRLIEGALPFDNNSTLPKSEVSGVSPSNGAASGETPTDSAEVSEVSKSVPGANKRPAFRVFEKVIKSGGTQYRPGVWFFGAKAGRGDAPPILTQTWVCSPLHVAAVTFDAEDNNFGRLLRLRTTLGSWREWAMPMELLRGSGDELRGELLAMGVEISPAAKNLLGNYLQAKPPGRRMRCALQTGWCGPSFVLPDTVIGPNASGVIFQSGERGHAEYTRAGTLKGWKSSIASRAIGNPILLFSVSASFAGPLLARCNGESGGAHFVGDSSTGKTTAIEAGCATWGGRDFLRSWRATANGMEGAATLCNDSLLALDEINQCDPREVGAIVYALANGIGKQRASRTGAARSVHRWRCFVLSSGERTIGTTMVEGGHRIRAGQLVRLLDVPATRRYGAWDALHDLPTGAAFSDAIREAAKTNYGHAGRAFLEKLTRDEREFCELLERIKKSPAFSPEGAEGQEKRAAARFAVVALAGELATEYGVTGWPEGAAIAAAAELFKGWRAQRGKGNDERRQILERVSDFIERYGDGRFADASGDSDVIIRDRAGWWRSIVGGGREYLFTAGGMREALKGFDFTPALNVLEAAGALPPADAKGRRTRFFRIDGEGWRLYPINPEKLGGEHGA
ncbi:MAG: DUF927 domain-containing protein [Beijerinckiaceae bacterium]